MNQIIDRLKAERDRIDAAIRILEDRPDAIADWFLPQKGTIGKDIDLEGRTKDTTKRKPKSSHWRPIRVRV